MLDSAGMGASVGGMGVAGSALEGFGGRAVTVLILEGEVGDGVVCEWGLQADNASRQNKGIRRNLYFNRIFLSI